jgi:hypothetical protein
MSVVAYKGMESYFWYYVLYWINPPNTIAAYTAHQIISDVRNEVIPVVIPYAKMMYYTMLTWYVLKLLNEVVFFFRPRILCVR